MTLQTHMMKLNFKILSICIVLAAIVISPAFVSAIVGTGGANFCTNLNTFSTQYSSAVQQRVNALQQKIEQSNASLASVRVKEDQALSTTRQNMDAKKEQYYAQLEAKATTDEQKTAVQNFETAMDAASTARKSAIDAANKAFRDGVDAIIAQKQPLIQQAGPAFEAAVKSAFDKAKSSCTSGTASATVRSTLLTDLKTAKDQFKTAVNAGNAINSQMKTLKATRNSAFKKAATDYKTAVQKATADLKAVFK